MRPHTAAIRRTALFALGAALAGTAPDARAQATRFTIQAIPTFGGTSSFALAISSTGLVSGNAQTALGTPNPRLNAFLWDGTSLTNLGTIPGSNNFSRGYGVNASGVVIGESDNNSPRAFRWENGTMPQLPTLGGPTAVAHGINDAGQIVGIANTGTASRAVIWENGGVRDLGAADGSTNTLARAWAINARGDVAGVSRAVGTTSQATLWAGGGAPVALGSLADGTRFSEAFALNDARQVVGRSFTGAVTASGTSIFEAFLWQGGTMTGLGSLGFTFSQANGINASGWIVGSATDVSGAPAAALLWQDGASVDLNTLVDDAAGWTLRSAQAINDRGQIVGYGTVDGQTRAFVLTPVAVIPEPTTVALVGAGVLVLAGAARRRPPV
jgi:probable HAF family extracellular repeat protein